MDKAKRVSPAGQRLIQFIREIKRSGAGSYNFVDKWSTINFNVNPIFGIFALHQ